MIAATCTTGGVRFDVTNTGPETLNHMPWAIYQATPAGPLSRDKGMIHQLPSGATTTLNAEGMGSYRLDTALNDASIVCSAHRLYVPMVQGE